jgi:hypothetical protein
MLSTYVRHLASAFKNKALLSPGLYANTSLLSRRVYAVGASQLSQQMLSAAGSATRLKANCRDYFHFNNASYNNKYNYNNYNNYNNNNSKSFSTTVPVVPTNEHPATTATTPTTTSTSSPTPAPTFPVTPTPPSTPTVTVAAPLATTPPATLPIANADGSVTGHMPWLLSPAELQHEQRQQDSQQQQEQLYYKEDVVAAGDNQHNTPASTAAQHTTQEDQTALALSAQTGHEGEKELDRMRNKYQKAQDTQGKDPQQIHSTVIKYPPGMEHYLFPNRTEEGHLTSTAPAAAPTLTTIDSSPTTTTRTPNVTTSIGTPDAAAPSTSPATTVSTTLASPRRLQSDEYYKSHCSQDATHGQNEIQLPPPQRKKSEEHKPREDHRPWGQVLQS